MRHRYLTADVFTDRVFGGNPLAVFPRAEGIDPASMQQIAREMNLSETTFVLPPEAASSTRRVRIFTPTQEIPFAGHPTLGTAFVLAATGEIPLDGAETRIVLEEGVGPVPVRIEARNGVPVRTELEAAQPPELGPPPPPREQIAEAISLDPDDVLEGREAPTAASCGLPFLFVPLRSRDTLARARIASDAWERHLAKQWAPDVYLYTRDTGDPDVDFRARMYAPAYGVPEDPATGSAVAALAGILAPLHAEPDADLRFRIEQGVEMGRPSRIELAVEKRGGEVRSVRVAGASVLAAEGEMEVPGAGA